jgi:WD40 repeat protein
LASAGDDQDVHLWDPVRGEPVAVLSNRRDGVLTLAFSSDGSLLATGGHAGTLIVWNVSERSRLPMSSVCLAPIVSVTFSSNGRTVLAGIRTQRYGGEPGKLICWEVGQVGQVRPFSDVGWVGEVESVAYCPARDLFAVGRLDRAVELFEVGHRQRDPLLWMPVRIRALCFSPDQGRLLAIATGRIIQIWNIEDNRGVAVCRGHRADIHALAFSPDGQLLLSGGADRSVRLWETISGRELAAWDWQIGPIHAVTFSPDGMTSAASGDRPAVVVWDIDDG